MLDFIYTLFIAPLEFWMQKALMWGFEQTHTWGWAIIVMSLVVNFVILPIYMKAESWQEEERAIRKSFEAKEAMIKATFKGQERFAMISTMHRQAGFSPFLAMRSSIGFFLQIPFFFAAYHFLSHFEPLQGVAFMGLADLSKPDEMFHIGGFAINVMPILMTVINLVSALVYTQNMSRKDKIQLYGMAALFLVLLYDAASGLVLYWTFNNIFSLCKNIVYDLYHRFGRKTIESIKQCFPKHKATNEVFPQSSFMSGYLVFLWGISAIFALLSSNQMDLISDATKVQLSFISDIGFVLTGFACLVELVLLKVWKHHKVLLAFSLLVLYYGLNTWFKWQFTGANRHYFALIAGLLFLIPVIGLTHLRCNLNMLLMRGKNAIGLYTPAVSWLIILVTAYLPIQAFCTAPELFSPTADVLALLLKYSVIGIVFFWVLDKVFKFFNAENFAGYFFSLLTLLFTIYAFLLPMDVGTIDAFQISDPAPLYLTKNLLVDFVVLILFFAGFIWLTRQGKVTLIRNVFIICCVLGLGSSTLSLWQSRGQWQTESDSTTVTLPSYNDRLLGFSKDKTNIVVVMLDAFSGSHIDILFNEYPELKDQYRGFVWYRNMLASGDSTVSSLPSIICGEKCAPWSLNENETDKSLAEKINRYYAETLNKFGPQFDIAIHERNWLEPNRLNDLVHDDMLAIRFMGDSYLNRYLQKNDITLGRGSSDSFLLAVSLFNSVPWSMKNLVYKDGRWIENLMPKSDTLVVRALREYAFIDGLADLSNTNATKATYKFFDNEITHHPWLMDAKTCTVSAKPKIYKTRQDNADELHLANEMCALKALSRWINWMKSEGIFDNTMIILVSDHDGMDSDMIGKVFGSPYKGMVGKPNPLLLVKHLGRSGNKDVEINDMPLSLTDVSKLIDNDLNIQPFTGRTQPRRMSVTGGKTMNKFVLEREWMVDSDMTRRDHWKELQ